MTWRLATSLQVLLDQINQMYPDRSKVTDGAISGYPGSVSGHNPNAAGVVCAFDITTGDYPGGITMAESYPLADAIREELLVAPRGLYTYLIHHMEPPWVPAPGKYIAHGGPASLWQWIPYTGSDPHTSHIHVSVDWDIPAGGAASGEDPYDMTDPWNLTSISGQSGTITPILEDIVTPEDIQAIAAAVEDRIFNKHMIDNHVVPGAAPDTFHNWAAWMESRLKGHAYGAAAGVPLAVLNQAFKTPSGWQTNLAGILSQIDAKPASTTATASVDVNALADKLAATLPPAVVAALAAKLAQP